MCDGMVAFQMRALPSTSSSSSSSSSSSLAHSLAASVFLLLLTLLPHGHASGCPRPASILHGDLVNQTEANRGSFPPGTLLSYSCETGYIAEGPTTIICTSSGAWSHQPPHCTRSNVCLPPTEPENGGYRCHPSPCHRLTQKTVIEYFCDEGYALKGDYKFLTCQNGEWDAPMQISCRLSQDKEPNSPLGMPTLSIVASTASSVALILLLVVLFVLLQPNSSPSITAGGSRESQASPAPSWWRGSRWLCLHMRKLCMAAVDPAVPRALLLLLPLQSLGSRSCSLRASPKGPLEARAQAEPTTTET
uniref:Sushi domain containing 6 n=1 Tax=Myripristis murdjan TaxID=586833 RepID=A0A667ZGS5_9TELE